LLNEQIDWATRQPGVFSRFGPYDTEAYFGRVRNARELVQTAEEQAVKSDLKERAAWLRANEAIRDAEFGYRDLAREHARRALAVAPGPDTQVLALLSMAETGEPTRARELTNQLKDKFPSGTLLQNYWIPTILAETELALNNPLGAIELL